MAKDLKRKNEKEDNKTKKVLKKNKKVEEDLELNENENDNVISSKTSHISDERLNKIIKNLKEKGLYYDDLDEFLKSDSKDGVHCNHYEDGRLVMHVKAEKPQEAMDKLCEYGFISEADRDLFKQRFDYLESKGIDVSQIKGGDLNNLRDDKLFEQYEKDMMEQYGPKSPVKGNAPDVQIGRQEDVKQPVVEPLETQDEVQISDEDLLRKFEQIQNDVGLDNKPDVTIGHDREMGD
jgi:hypothetical protein